MHRDFKKLKVGAPYRPKLIVPGFSGCLRRHQPSDIIFTMYRWHMRSVRISNWSSRLQWDTLLLMELLRICGDTGVTRRAWAVHQRLCSMGTANLAHTRCAGTPPAPHMYTPQHHALETAHPEMSSLEILGTSPHTSLLREKVSGQ